MTNPLSKPFGLALHMLLTRTVYLRLSGTVGPSAN